MDEVLVLPQGAGLLWTPQQSAVTDVITVMKASLLLSICSRWLLIFSGYV